MSVQNDIKTSQNDFRNLSNLFGDALSQFAKLFQTEVDLAKAELTEKAQQVGGAMGFLAGGAIMVIPALVMALFALSAALIAAGWSQPLFLPYRGPRGSGYSRRAICPRHKSARCPQPGAA
jgi:hypothetical protein